MKCVYLEWIDSISTGGWQAKVAPDMRIRSIGILVSETKESITISTSSASIGGFESPLTIPKCAITKRKRVKI